MKRVGKVKQLLIVVLVVLIQACSSAGPENELELAAQQLEDSVKNKQHNAITKQMHADFKAQNRYGKQQARQQMLGLFMRYKNISVMVMNRKCELDASFYDRGRCSAKVGITGAQGVFPDRADYLQVNTLWQHDGKQWQLIELKWH